MLGSRDASDHSKKPRVEKSRPMDWEPGEHL